MFTLIIIIILALVFFSYAAIPLIVPNQSDPLPDYQDPVKKELIEERDALLRAIKEIDNRSDLKDKRREDLKRRYEAKTAKVLRSLDEYSNKEVKTIKESKGRGLPYAIFGLLVLMVVSATTLSAFVYPRVGNNLNSTASGVDQKRAAAQLKELLNKAESEPNEENLLAIAEYYWHRQDVDGSIKWYTKAIESLDPIPAIAAHRLGLLVLQTDIDKSLEYFTIAHNAEPGNLDTLYALGEVNFRLGNIDQAIKYLEDFVAQPEGAKFEDVQQRLESFKNIAPALNAATQDASDENLLALADAYWATQERELSANIYLNLLKKMDPAVEGIDPKNARIFSRIGQYFFIKGNNDDAITMLDRATTLNPDDMDGLLFLGNAYFSAERYKDAIKVWTRIVEAIGPVEAGRVPGLIESAQARIDAQENPDAMTGRQLFVANCTVCHGENGEGGVGPMLVGNKRAADRANVADMIKFGRGSMPGFGPKLSDIQQETLTDYIVKDLSQQ